jgi:hypothetical protein
MKSISSNLLVGLVGFLQHNTPTRCEALETLVVSRKPTNTQPQTRPIGEYGSPMSAKAETFEAPMSEAQPRAMQRDGPASNTPQAEAAATCRQCFRGGLRHTHRRGNA